MKLKKESLPFSPIFICYHVILLIGLLIVLISGRMHVTTDFISLLPSTGISEGVAKAERVFASRQNGKVNILLGHEDFNTVKESSISLYNSLIDSNTFSELSLEGGELDMDELSSFLSSYRYNIIPNSAKEDIINNPSLFQQQSLSSIFAPMTFASLDNLDSDPFFIDELIYRDLLDKVSMSSPVMPKDGVLAKEKDGIWYVLLQGTLTEESLNIANTKGGIKTIYEIGDNLSNSVEGLSISYSGFPFHSYESASNAQKEIAIITGLSIAAILIMFIILLRNIHVVGFFLISTTFSIFSAFAAISIFFPDIHILTMIFGTSLIGTSIDYAIHYYLAYAHKHEGENGYIVAKGLRKNLSVSFISTALCYAFILFSPYGILRQVAVFSVAGLLSSYLTVMGFFPLISKPKMISSNALAWKIKSVKEHKSYTLPLLVICLILVAVLSPKMEVKNSISNLYEMSDRLLKSEMTVGDVLGFSSTSYVIIEGEDEIDARNKEAEFSNNIKPFIENGSVERYLSPSLFIPSPKEQEENLSLRSYLVPYSPTQINVLGLDETKVYKELTEDKEILTFDSLPKMFKDTINPIVPGLVDGKYYITVLVFGENGDDSVRELSNNTPYDTYFCKAKDVDKQLDALTQIILRIFFIAFIVIIVMLIVVFKKKGLYMVSSPLITVCAVIGVVTIAGMKFDFFFAVGLLIVIGLGLDYMVFAGNSDKKPLLAITLSYATTALSFGTLLFSSFKPVHILGFTVFVGITASYVCALLSGNKQKEIKKNDEEN